MWPAAFGRLRSTVTDMPKNPPQRTRRTWRNQFESSPSPWEQYCWIFLQNRVITSYLSAPLGTFRETGKRVTNLSLIFSGAAREIAISGVTTASNGIVSLG